MSHAVEAQLMDNESPAPHRRASIVVVGARGIPDVEGGAEKNAEMLFPLLVQRGFKVTLIGLRNLMNREEYRGVKLVGVTSRRWLKTDKLFYYLSCLPRVARIRPDIVHMQGLGSCLFLWAYKLMGCRTVVRYGSADYLVSKWGVIGRAGFRIAEWQTRFADAVIAVTPALATRLAEIGVADNVHVIPNALDEAPRVNEASQSDPFVLFVGRVTAQKNVNMLVRAFEEFRRRSGKPYRLLIAGGLDDTEYVKRLKPELSENTVLLGRCNREQLEELLSKCTLFINPSIHEGSSNATLEAISRQCPVIVSSIPENRDFHLADAAYFDPDEEASIAAAMLACAQDPDRYRADLRKFLRWSDVEDRTSAVYEKILASRSRTLATAG